MNMLKRIIGTMFRNPVLLVGGLLILVAIIAAVIGLAVSLAAVGSGSRDLTMLRWASMLVVFSVFCAIAAYLLLRYT